MSENLEVLHKAFGKGRIVSNNGKYITVEFENDRKVFVYPDAFEKFLTLVDGTVSPQIISDIEAAKREKQIILDNKHQENLRAMTKGIVIPGKDIVLPESDDGHGFKTSESEEL